METKYVVPIVFLADLLRHMSVGYRVLQTTETCLSEYETVYFDTADMALHRHIPEPEEASQKIRLRRYRDRRRSYLEVKNVYASGLGDKRRARHDFGSLFLNSSEHAFVRGLIPKLSNELLLQQLSVRYRRMTFLGLETHERVTMDLDVQFGHGVAAQELDDTVIVEIKRAPGLGQHSAAENWLSMHGFGACTFSKYRTGLWLSANDASRRRRLRLCL